MIRLNIDGLEVKGFAGQTILEIAKENAITIPTLCHDERVKTYGACGICVVEIEGSNKLIRSCATEAEDDMIIYTNTDRIKQSRKTTLELLISDHTGDCRPPCLTACPANTDCQGYVGLIANGQHKEAVELVKEKIPLPTSIGLVCPHPCEDACRRKLVEEPVAIAALKAFVGYESLYSQDNNFSEVKGNTGKTVAIVGSGPAGLTAAYFLAKEGHSVTIYEAMPKPGGMLRYGIPEYRLPKELLDKEIKVIEQLGVTIITDTKIGTDITLDYIKANCDAVFLAIGAWESSKIGCTGEDNEGVLGGIDFLRQVAMNTPVHIGNKVAVVGGGNTAMDAARTAVRLGANEVYVMYRRTRAEMPAEDIEIIEAEEEGVIFKFLVAPEEIIAEEGAVSSIKVQKMELGEPDSSGRRRPVPIEGEVELIAVDTVIAAIGQKVNAKNIDNVGLSKWGSIDIDESNFMTNIEGVFAGGDGVTGPGIAIEAIAQGKGAFEAMNAYLNGQKYSFNKPFLVEKEITQEMFKDYIKEKRVELDHLNPNYRKTNFKQVSSIFTEDEAIKEANRCLECGCLDFFECKLIDYANDYSINPEVLYGEKHKYLEIKKHDYIIRETDKCILCGLCVRVCDEVMGIAALGLVHRGFDTVVQPEFGVPLNETDCITCGQCISVCPTGALTENNIAAKNVPLKLEQNETTCSVCTMGCTQEFHYKGDTIYKVLPSANGLLCFNGRFKPLDFSEKRITQPLIQSNGEFREVSWKEAYDYITKQTQVIRGNNNQDSAAIFISPQYTCEEADVVKALANDCLQTNYLSSFNPSFNNKFINIVDDINNNNLEDMLQTDVILMVGEFKNSPIAPVKAREAANNGAKVIVISENSTLADDLASIRTDISLSTSHLIQELLYAINNEENNISKVVEQIAQIYTNAQNAMILADGNEINSDLITALYEIAKTTNHINRPRNGILYINSGGNIKGIIKAGFKHDYFELVEKINMNEIKIAFILDQNPISDKVNVNINNLDLLVVSASTFNETAKKADVILPSSYPFETKGTYIGIGDKKLQLNKIYETPTGKDNTKVIREICFSFL
ncbi:putative bifurcating oxidoreductase, alpha (oxidoreductase) subunit [Candidatus Syntrophocurvum alkaliphilum]|uniref:Putative bifurcating oxidoreductase, alpha (Oxidoreductase) subunit n=1 Tax=Candidatus Syntrophocurvum alkaliphilum TaxID=2293317 RepID=A0A6I6DEW1_9FIRM|nr:FAD-dependent oxidoreductase [Candidatus Syntrophocurvum alkaliphilum]QGT99021.1 putative bifurcating oxidoreductase, alpha (oxidoreductase) subunit [Candidatus Syntrophocurvum alkaliphilum]